MTAPPAGSRSPNGAATIQPAAHAPEVLRLKERTLGWLASMHVPGTPGAYRLNADADSTPFSSCFAVFLRHLFGDLDQCPAEERRAWLAALLDLQDPVSGLFVDPENVHRTPDNLHDPDHLNYQLTTFCLGAVHALQGRPRHRLGFLDAWPADRIVRWLDGLDWSNPWNSGNKAMFIGICLVYEREHTGGRCAGQALDAWFDWHNRRQNRSGFWGDGMRAHHIDGLGGAYHQLTLYHYMERSYARGPRMVDRILFLQQPDGMFSPYGGGASCYELDAVDVLVHLYRRHDHRRGDIRRALRRTLKGVLVMQNADGGFCWGRPEPIGSHWAHVLKRMLTHPSPYDWYRSARAAAAITVRRTPRLRTGWAAQPRLWTESSVFDTWLRCLTIAEICSVLEDSPYATYPWRYLAVPGLGWFPSRR